MPVLLIVPTYVRRIYDLCNVSCCTANPHTHTHTQCFHLLCGWTALCVYAINKNIKSCGTRKAGSNLDRNNYNARIHKHIPSSKRLMFGMLYEILFKF